MSISDANSMLSLPKRIALDKNENPFGLPPAPREDLREMLASLDLNRYPDPDSLLLRASLSDLTGFPAETIVTGNGGDELLFLLFAALVRPGDRIVRLSPAFSQYEHCSRLFGADERLVEIELTSNGFRIDREKLLDAIAAASPKLVCIDSPNNPTGVVLPPDFLAELASLVPGTLLIDEAYAEFAGSSVLTLFERTMPRRTVVLRTLSKAWGLAGMRLGYAIGDPESIALLNDFRGPFNVNAFSQAAARVLLGYREWMESRVYSIRYLREVFTSEMNRLPGWRAFPSEANFVLVRSPLPENQLRTHFVEAGIDARFLPLPWQGSWARITIGREDEMRVVLEVCRSMTETSSYDMVACG